MYKCTQCDIKTENPDEVYDAYDKEIYKVCPLCTERLAAPEAFCGMCGEALFGGETAFEIGTVLYCKECITEVEL